MSITTDTRTSPVLAAINSDVSNVESNQSDAVESSNINQEQLCESGECVIKK